MVKKQGGQPKYTKEQMEELIPRCVSFNHMAELLGVTGISVATRSRISEWGIDTSHFYVRSIPKEEFFVYDRFGTGKRTSSSTLRKYLKVEREYVCERCGVGDSWCEGTLTLHIDHINGDGIDNRLENLRFLCPNCHSQTETYCGRKVRPLCPVCGEQVSTNGHTYCSNKCAALARRKSRPAKEELEALLENRVNSIASIAARYGVTDVTLNRWAEEYGIDKTKAELIKRKMPPKEELVEALATRKVTLVQLAKTYDVSEPTFRKWIHYYQLEVPPLRAQGVKVPPPPKEELKKKVESRTGPMREVAAEYEVSIATLNVWVQKYGIEVGRRRYQKND